MFKPAAYEGSWLSATPHSNVMRRTSGGGVNLIPLRSLLIISTEFVFGPRKKITTSQRCRDSSLISGTYQWYKWLKSSCSYLPDGGRHWVDWAIRSGSWCDWIQERRTSWLDTTTIGACIVLFRGQRQQQWWVERMKRSEGCWGRGGFMYVCTSMRCWAAT